MTVLGISSVRKDYGSTAALAGIDLELAEGELCGLLGPNGAGKSTLAKIVCGLVRPTAGTVIVAGHEPGSHEANSAIGYLAELFRFPGWLSAGEVVELHQDLAGSDGGIGEVERLLELVGLGDEAGRRVETMSKGMQQRLGLAQAMVGSPRLLLLDEPTSALDPSGRRAIRDVLTHLRETGVSILLSSHLLSEVELVCDRVAILYRGEIVAEGDTENLTARGGVEIETDQGTTTHPDLARDEIPRVVGELVAAGRRIYSVRPVKSTLEDFYIETVAQEPQ